MSRWKKGSKIPGSDILKGSDDKHYNCATYAHAKLYGTSPDLCDDESHTWSVATLKQQLIREQFHEVRECRADNARASCAVLYTDTNNGDFHWAVYDHARKDWGGKLSANGTIARFKSPGDFIRQYPKDEQGKVSMTYYCKVFDQEPGRISDEKLHDDAKRCSD